MRSALVVSVGNQDFVAMLDREPFEALHQFGKKWILDVGDNQAINMALACPEGAGVRVRVVSGSLDRRPDSLFRARVDRRRAVHHT